ncbi:Zinc finger, RING/FYVE/PHD-type [Corchorus olitorius]|uniref:Zinc finger, RING/FYVE/PHD-type n=1 Tax=Corchorus olitorius TaxID=93759 RepID=A0A1R3HNX7_9ROSI|nr:Zinc finger, RING/FYVE/PHD-type [Corchorus olitorius]
MWSFASNAIASIGLKGSREVSRACSECSDDEVCSNGSGEEGLECPICWESFNIVENVPYVLWCGHTLCQNCILGLQSAILSLPTQKIKIPLFISCPWCHLLSLRLVYKGNLKFPRKNFFLLWMIESLNGDRYGVPRRTLPGYNEPVGSPRSNLSVGNQATNGAVRRGSYAHRAEQHRYQDNGGRNNVERHHFSLHKSLDFFIHFTSKFPLVIIFLLIVFFVIPGSAVILLLYLLVTVVFAIPSFLVLYFAYPMLERLVREITS